MIDRDSEKPIYALFEHNRDYPEKYPQPWYLKYFCVPGQEWEEGWEGRLLSDNFGKLPAAAKYEYPPFDANADFDDDYNLEHIVLDGIESDRYPHPFIEEYGGGFCRKRYEEAKKEKEEKEKEEKRNR